MQICSQCQMLSHGDAASMQSTGYQKYNCVEMYRVALLQIGAVVTHQGTRSLHLFLAKQLIGFIRMTSVDHRSNIETPSLWDRWALSLRDGNGQSPKKCFCFVNTILWNEFCLLSHMSQSSWGKRVQVRKNLSQNARHWLRVKLIEKPISISISCWLPWAMTLSTSWCW